MRAFVIAHHDARLRIRISMTEKRLSEVGFEPTPTFVDQNTPVRKSSTLESGALDRSAILTCGFGKNIEDLFARYRDKKNAHIRTLSGFQFRVSRPALRIPMPRGLSGNPKTKNRFKRATSTKTVSKRKGN